MGRDLAQRAEQSVARQGEDGESLQKQLAKMETQFQRAMPKGVEAVQLTRDVMTCVSRTPKLALAAQSKEGMLSILGSAMTCAQLGLRPGVGALGHAWILPFWDNKAREQRAQLIIGYKGYVELGQRSDRIGSLHSRIVYANDDFRLIYGLDSDDFEHTPYFMLGKDDPGAARLFYAVGRLANGGTAMADPMTLAQMEAHRDRFAMAKDRNGNIVGPWRDHFDSMAKKTMLLRLMALMPKSTEIERAITNDGAVRMDTALDAIDDPNVVDGEVIGEPVDTVDEPPARESVRVTAPAEDPPPPSPADPTPDNPEVPLISPNQSKNLHRLLGKEGLGGDTAEEKKARHDWLSTAVGRPIKSSNDLTSEEAGEVIAMLQAAQDQEAGR